MRLKLAGLTLASLLLSAAGCDYRSQYPTAAPPVDPPARSFAEGLWTVSGSPSEIVRLDAGQLLAGGILAPATRLFTSSASLFTLNSVAFDSAGTLWVASQDDSLLLAFVPETDAGSGFTTPTVIIEQTSRSISGPTGIAFDSDGSLWVANFASATIVRFTRAQLAQSGSPIPSVIITGIEHPTGLAFDATGSLWVSDILANTVSRYQRGQLLASGEKAPATVLSATGASLVHPSGIAFDAANNMWIANTGNESVTAFRPPQRETSGAPEPFVTLRSSETSLGVPSGLAFDTEGSLWIVGGSGVVTKFTLASIAGSGRAEPSLQISLADHVLLWSVAFWPKPSGFPLN